VIKDAAQKHSQESRQKKNKNNGLGIRNSSHYGRWLKLKTRVQKLWHKIDNLKVLLDSNPHVPIVECKALVQEIEQLIMAMRRREIRAGRLNMVRRLRK
jgi:hypothetical protein